MHCTHIRLTAPRPDWQGRAQSSEIGSGGRKMQGAAVAAAAAVEQRASRRPASHLSPLCALGACPHLAVRRPSLREGEQRTRLHVCAYMYARASARSATLMCLCVCHGAFYTEGACLVDMPLHSRRTFASLYVK